MNFLTFETSYLLIVAPNALNALTYTLDYYKHDYDIVEEPLGILYVMLNELDSRKFNTLALIF